MNQYRAKSYVLYNKNKKNIDDSNRRNILMRQQTSMGEFSTQYSLDIDFNDLLEPELIFGAFKKIKK